MSKKRGVNLHLLLDQPIVNATEVAKSKIKTVQTHLRDRFLCIQGCLHELWLPKEIAAMILEFDDLCSLQWRSVFEITQQPSKAPRANTARPIWEWCQWYSERRVSLREVCTLYFSMFQDKTIAFEFDGSCIILLRDEKKLEIRIGDWQTCSLRFEDQDHVQNFCLLRVGKRLGIKVPLGGHLFLPLDAVSTFFSELMNTVENEFYRY